jgi:hypothetical protein
MMVRMDLAPYKACDILALIFEPHKSVWTDCHQVFEGLQAEIFRLVATKLHYEVFAEGVLLFHVVLIVYCQALKGLVLLKGFEEVQIPVKVYGQRFNRAGGLREQLED